MIEMTAQEEQVNCLVAMNKTYKLENIALRKETEALKSKFNSLEEEVKEFNSGSGGGTHKENHQVLYFTTNNALYSFNT